MPAGLNVEGQVTIQYCHSCAEQVLTYTARSDDRVDVRCAYCGLPLGRQFPEAEVPIECALLADDEKFSRWVLRDLLVENHLAKTVVPCEGGTQLLTRFTERLRRKEPTQLIVLDILMPDLDGLAAAKAIRAVERGFGITWPVPILFLSALRPDTAIRNFVARVQPALFLNKAVDATPDRLAIQLREMIEYFSRARNGALAIPVAV